MTFSPNAQPERFPCGECGKPVTAGEYHPYSFCLLLDGLPAHDPQPDDHERVMTARFIVGDVFDVLATLPDGSVDCIVTSPPFLALRSYLPADHPDKGKEIGSEPTPAAFLDTMLDLTAEWRRVLTPHGSICVELGDTYAGSGGAGGDYGEGGLRDGQPKFRQTSGWHRGQREGRAEGAAYRKIGTEAASPNGGEDWPLPKSLTGIPTLYAWSLAYGRNLLNPEHVIEPWRIRNLIAWTRPNPPVGALGDKVRPATSYVTTACVSGKRYFDLDAERTEHKSDPERYTGNGYTKGQPMGDGHPVMKGNPVGAPLLDWWAIPTQPYAGSHYATFPEELPRRLISLMCPQRVCRECGEPSRRITETTNAIGEATGRRSWRAGTDGIGAGHSGDITRSSSSAPTAEVVTLGWTDCGHDAWRPGIVLDPFAGSGTTLAVAVGMGRQAIGIDLDERNALLAEQRVGMFLTVDGAPTPRTEEVVNL